MDTNLGACVRSYGQGDALTCTAAYMEGELGTQTAMNKVMVRDANFVLKQVIPLLRPLLRSVLPGASTTT